MTDEEKIERLERKMKILEEKVELMHKISLNQDEILKCHKTMMDAINGKIDATVKLISIMGS